MFLKKRGLAGDIRRKRGKMERVSIRELSQLRYLKREITLQRDRLAALRCRSTSVSPRLDGMPRARAATDRVGGMACEIAYLEQLIAMNMRRAICELLKLQQFINDIPDSGTRMLFHYRYVECKSWPAIAFLLELGDDSTARKRHDLYLKEGRAVRRDARTSEQRRFDEQSGRSGATASQTARAAESIGRERAAGGRDTAPEARAGR